MSSVTGWMPGSCLLHRLHGKPRNTGHTTSLVLLTPPVNFPQNALIDDTSHLFHRSKRQQSVPRVISIEKIPIPLETAMGLISPCTIPPSLDPRQALDFRV
ncbi:hypothetical protein VTN96DRAFT_6774 [Rasamsonia emersonii]